jgi:hypothetical protein
MTKSDLYRKNVDFLSRTFPAYAQHLGAVSGDTVTPIFADGIAIDIQVGTQRLYNGDARAVAAAQVEPFLAKPARVGYDAKSFSTDSLVSRDLFERLRNGMGEYGLTVVPSAPVGRSGYMLIFGIGLGYHLRPLIEAVDVDHVIVIEVVGEFYDASCHAIDWPELQELCAARGAKLHVIVTPSPYIASADTIEIVEYEGAVLLDGAYCFRHYPLWALDEAYRRTINELPRQIIARGYYEDERKMIRNAVTNLHKCDFYLAEGSFRTRTMVPAFFIASGPSIDESIEFVKQWRDHAIVFSCGSSLQICLRHGIIPDYHVELENIVAVVDFLEHMLDKNPDLYPNRHFDGIRLIASVTVNPRTMSYFDETLFFFRDSSVSSKCFADDVPIMTAVGPNVTNTAVSVAARLGFGEMYFFGLDCGWRDESVHHSKDTAYYTDEKVGAGRAKTSTTVPGNFGGEIQTDTVLDWSRDMLEQKLRHFCIEAYNCSDGALIEGAVPMLPEALNFTGPLPDRQAVMDSIRDQSCHFAPGEFLKRFDMGSFVTEADAYRDALYPIIDRAIAERQTFAEFHSHIWPMMRDVHTNPLYRHIAALFSYATMGMIKLACYYLNRIEDPGIRETLTVRFYGDFRELHERMLTEGRTIMEEARIMVAGGPEPDWTKGLQTVPGTTY